MSEKRTPPKPACTNKLLECVQGKLSNSHFHCDSAFRFLPNVSTPPNQFTKIMNPFEPHLTERLHLPVFSPSVFRKEAKTDDKFKWTIEDISSLKPADIDESNVHQHEHDPELEFAAQAKIEKFFSEKHIVPSPFNAIKSVPLISDSLTPIKPDKQSRHSADGVTQTVLTLPPDLPDHINAMLKPYFSYTCNQQQGQTAAPNSSLYQQIFESHDANLCDSPSSVLTSPAPSCNLSPRLFSPCDSHKADDNQRGSPRFERILSECNLSPIGGNSPRLPSAKVDMLSYMSVDTSFNVVPDFQDHVLCDNTATLDSFHEMEKEHLSESTVNWDVEYKHISLASSGSEHEESERMDVSNSNTPKSHFLSNQPKKLSQERRSVKNALFSDEDTTDAGYDTGVHTMGDESTYLFASTPTKAQLN